MGTAIARQRKLVARGERNEQETRCPVVNANSVSSAWLLEQLAESLVDELA